MKKKKNIQCDKRHILTVKQHKDVKIGIYTEGS
jgi:hypothetical protein